jgi:hypothetical protein
MSEALFRNPFGVFWGMGLKIWTEEVRGAAIHQRTGSLHCRAACEMR